MCCLSVLAVQTSRSTNTSFHFNKRTVNFYYRLCISFQAYLVERYLSSSPLSWYHLGNGVLNKYLGEQRSNTKRRQRGVPGHLRLAARSVPCSAYKNDLVKQTPQTCANRVATRHDATDSRYALIQVDLRDVSRVLVYNQRIWRWRKMSGKRQRQEIVLVFWCLIHGKNSHIK